MPITVDIDGVLHKLTGVYTNVNGVIHPLTGIYTNVNGVIQPIYTMGEYLSFRWGDFSGESTYENYNIKYLGEFTLQNRANLTISFRNTDGLECPTDVKDLDVVDTVIVARGKITTPGDPKEEYRYRVRWNTDYDDFVKDNSFVNCQDIVKPFNGAYNDVVHSSTFNCLAGTYYVYGGKYAVESSGKTRSTINDDLVDTITNDGINYEYPLQYFSNSDLSFNVRIKVETVSE